LAGYALALDMTARELQAVAKVNKEKRTCEEGMLY